LSILGARRRWPTVRLFGTPLCVSDVVIELLITEVALDKLGARDISAAEAEQNGRPPAPLTHLTWPHRDLTR
jgi:hypothetical protein